MKKLSKWIRKIFHLKPKVDEPLPMHPENILIISSSGQDFYNFIESIRKVGYTPNSDTFRLDNGDFAQVVVKVK